MGCRYSNEGDGRRYRRKADQDGVPTDGHTAERPCEKFRVLGIRAASLLGSYGWDVLIVKRKQIPSLFGGRHRRRKFELSCLNPVN